MMFSIDYSCFFNLVSLTGLGDTVLYIGILPFSFHMCCIFRPANSCCTPYWLIKYTFSAFCSLFYMKNGLAGAKNCKNMGK